MAVTKYITLDNLATFLHKLKECGLGNDVNDFVGVQNITYGDLVALQRDSKLAPGLKYRITDYITTTSQTDTINAEYQFDVIVEAMSSNELSENAKVSLHKDDTYFTNCNLNAWEIKYCIDNDTNRFTWADEENGKGVIYYMKDEWGNECWYDFKNIKFKRTAEWVSEHPKIKDFNDELKFDTEEEYFFTFDWNGTDDSLNYGEYKCEKNIIGKAYDPTSKKALTLNNTIFLGNGNANNILGMNSKDNTFGFDTFNNVIGSGCQGNVMPRKFSYNNIGIGFQGNIGSGDNYNYNTIKDLCQGNKFNGSVINCSIGCSFKNNDIVGDVQYSILGDNIEYNTFLANIKRYSITHCQIGNRLVYAKDIPYLNKVNIESGILHLTEPTSIETLKDNKGIPLYSSLANRGSGEGVITLTKNDSGNYVVYKNNEISEISKIDNIFDLGTFDNSAAAEDAAKNPNIAINKKYTYLKYVASDKNCIGVIEQTVSNISSVEITTTQYLNFDGKHYVRRLFFRNVGSGWSLIMDSEHNSEWNVLKFVTEDEWAELKNKETEITNLIQEINYSDLVDLKNDNSLIPGTKYRITDYITTTTQEYTTSARHPFDIIVEALDESTLLEDAKVCKSKRDITYTFVANIYDSNDIGWFNIPQNTPGEIVSLTTNPISYQKLSNKECNAGEVVKIVFKGTVAGGSQIKGLGAILRYNDEIVAIDYGFKEDNTFYLEAPVTGYMNIEVFADGAVNSTTDGVCGFSAGRYNKTIYFDECDLNAWEIKYCLDNDINRFAWADTKNGKGVIYYMKDEWGNECPYDFKNITFDSDGKNYFTFSYEVNSVIYDGTVHNEVKNCHDNIIKSYTESNKQILNNIKFINTSFGSNCHNNSFGSNCSNNSFGSNCHNNSFGYNCSNNSFGYGCYNNSFGYGCYNNSFGYGCNDNSFGYGCYSNTFKGYCSLNTFRNKCSNNQIGDVWEYGTNCTNNTFENDCKSNVLRNECSNNTFGNGCYNIEICGKSNNNTFGDVCQNIMMGINCISNQFGKNCNTFSADVCTYNILGDNCYNIQIAIRAGGNGYIPTSNICVGTGCKNLVLKAQVDSDSYQNTFQNYSIGAGLTGEIEILGPDIFNREYETKIMRNSKGEIKQYCEADLLDITYMPSNPTVSEISGSTITFANNTTVTDDKLTIIDNNVKVENDKLMIS